jgi:hypothetical protein
LTIVPKNGMNPLRILSAEGEYNSSRFSGPCNPVYLKGIAKKDTTMPVDLKEVPMWPAVMARI